MVKTNLVFSTITLITFLGLAKETITSSPDGQRFVLLPGSFYNITWRFDVTRNILVWAWSFTPRGSSSPQQLARFIDSGNTPQYLSRPFAFEVFKTGTLCLENVNESYNGEFTFTISTTPRTPPSKVNVYIAAKPNALINCSTPLVVSKGGSVSCVCRGEGGNPPANVTWYDKNNNIIGDVGVVNKTLVITNVTVNDGGSYRCKAQSYNDPRFRDEKSIEITVKATYNVLCDYQKGRIKQCKTEWYIILITLTSGIIVGILVSIVFQYRRHWFSKNCQQFQSPSEVRINSVDTTYQGLDLSKMNKEDNYQSLRPKDDTVDKTYQELDISKMNIEDNNYESLQKNDESEYVIADERRNYENSNLFSRKS